ncbi:hypothetical protein [Bacillus sp. JJ1562]|uniref:hypothetical protein n=1 Tax=Bacillus sp. JJ1562 TaxID=3122960 RepID=UPI003003590C
MSRIMINPNQVIGMSPQVGSIGSKLSSIEGGVSSVRNSIDYRILARTSIRPQLTEASRSIEQLEAKVKKLEAFLNLAVTRYSSTERYLNGTFMTMEAARTLKPAIPESGGKKVESSNKDTSSLVHKILSYFGTVNTGLSMGDIAVVGSQLLSVGTSAFLARNLKVTYVGGKPTWGQKFTGKYKFTVTANPSWTSRTGYSSKMAKFIRDFSRSTPTNPISKVAHSFISSYNNPSALLKHAAGFSKNVNAAMHGTTLMGRFHKRITIGAKDVVQNVAKAKGLTAVAKRIPFIGGLVSFGANTAEVFDPKNANLSVGEKVGRATAGIVTDIGAIAVGAKAGAMIGSVGGPVGIVVGGAIGGLAGGIASSAAGDVIKDVGQKIGGAIENVGKSIFNSVSSWFK